MNETVKLAMKKRAEKVIAALERNNMKGYLVDTPDEAKELIKEQMLGEFQTMRPRGS